MITYLEAQRKIEANSLPSKEETLVISAALGFVCSRSVSSPVDLPLFDNSAMDGFIVRAQDTQGATKERPIVLRLKGVIKAGDSGLRSLCKNEAYRIMTGACVADMGNAVLEVEKAVVKKNKLFITAPVPPGRNIRLRGEEIKKHDLVLKKGSVINPGTIGFLATMGLTEVKVYKKPSIALIATGSELVTPGQLLAKGKIYDSNTSMLQAALEELRMRPVLVRRLNDSSQLIHKVIRFALKESDIIILTGGVSAGDYDFVKDTLKELGVKTIFWKVKQKPGMPLFFGRKGDHLVFGLPGNPASVFTCFYEYVYPAIRRFMGYSQPHLHSEELKLSQPLNTDPDRVLFLKSKINCAAENTVIPLKHQKSHMISSLCEADSIISLPNSKRGYKEGDKVPVHYLPYSLGSHS